VRVYGVFGVFLSFDVHYCSGEIKERVILEFTFKTLFENCSNFHRKKGVVKNALISPSFCLLFAVQ